MRRIAIAQLGSNEIDQNVFVKELALATIRKIVPIALRAAAGMPGNAKHKDSLQEHANKCEQVETLDAASYAASYAARDSVLNLMAEIGVEALQKAGSPGCEWLDLAVVSVEV